MRAQLEPDRPAVGIVLLIYAAQGGFLNEELWLYPADRPKDPEYAGRLDERNVATRIVSLGTAEPTSEHLSLIATLPTHRADVYDLAYRLSRCGDSSCGGGHTLVLVTAEGLKARELLRVDAPNAIRSDASAGRLTLRWTEGRATDPACCPSLERVRLYERSDTGYRLLSDTVGPRETRDSTPTYPPVLRCGATTGPVRAEPSQGTEMVDCVRPAEVLAGERDQIQVRTSRDGRTLTQTISVRSEARPDVPLWQETVEHFSDGSGTYVSSVVIFRPRGPDPEHVLVTLETYGASCCALGGLVLAAVGGTVRVVLRIPDGQIAITECKTISVVGPTGGSTAVLAQTRYAQEYRWSGTEYRTIFSREAPPLGAAPMSPPPTPIPTPACTAS